MDKFMRWLLSPLANPIELMGYTGLVMSWHHGRYFEGVLIMLFSIAITEVIKGWDSDDTTV